MLLLLSGVMAIVPLAGLAYLWYVDPSLTVEKMFMTLIGLVISGLFALNALMELKIKIKGESQPTGPARGAASGSGVSAQTSVLTMGALREQGLVESVGYYESAVGRPNHSVITLRDGAGVRLISLLGDLRDQFPVGRKVEVLYKPDPQGYSLVQRRIYA